MLTDGKRETLGKAEGVARMSWTVLLDVDVEKIERTRSWHVSCGARLKLIAAQKQQELHRTQEWISRPPLIVECVRVRARMCEDRNE